MFDIGWGELVVIGVVALLVVGPKELPALLRTVGRYTGMLKKQAAEFRSQFDEAMRESELDQLRKDVENIKSEAESTLRAAEQSVQTEIAEAKSELDNAAAAATAKIEEAKAASESYDAPAALVDDSQKPPAASETAVNGSAADHAFNGSSAETPSEQRETPRPGTSTQ